MVFCYSFEYNTCPSQVEEIHVANTLVEVLVVVWAFKSIDVEDAPTKHLVVAIYFDANCSPHFSKSFLTHQWIASRRDTQYLKQAVMQQYNNNNNKNDGKV